MDQHRPRHPDQIRRRQSQDPLEQRRRRRIPAERRELCRTGPAEAEGRRRTPLRERQLRPVRDHRSAARRPRDDPGRLELADLPQPRLQPTQHSSLMLHVRVPVHVLPPTRPAGHDPPAHRRRGDLRPRSVAARSSGCHLGTRYANVRVQPRRRGIQLLPRRDVPVVPAVLEHEVEPHRDDHTGGLRDPARIVHRSSPRDRDQRARHGDGARQVSSAHAVGETRPTRCTSPRPRSRTTRRSSCAPRPRTSSSSPSTTSTSRAASPSTPPG